MKSTPKRALKTPDAGTHKKVTYTLPPDAHSAVDRNWRFHKTIEERFADSKSEYVADLILRDAALKKK